MNTFISSIIGLLIGLICAASCQQVKPEAPLETKNNLSIEAPLSTLVIPVQYDLVKLRELVNDKTDTLLMKQWLSLNQKGDSLYIEISKRSPIKMAWDKQTLYYTLPLKISGTFIKRVAGIKITNNKPIEMEVLLHLYTSLTFDNQWNLKPQSRLQKIEWIKEPSLKLVMIRVNLRNIAEKAIEEKEQILTQKLDEALSQLIKTRPTVEKIWKDLQKPIIINRKEVPVWLKVDPVKMYARLVDAGPDQIALLVELNAYLKSLLEVDTSQASYVDLPAYQPKVSESDSVKLFILAQLPFDRTNQVVNERLKGQMIESHGYSTSVKHIRMYGTDRGLAVEVRVKGDLSGKLFLRGDPVYDSATNHFYIRNFNYDIDTENALVNGADWFMHAEALKMISEKLVFDLTPVLQQLPQTISKGIAKGKVGEKIEVDIDTLMASLYDMNIRKTDIQFILKGEGKATIDLKKKVFDKKRPI